MRGSGSRPHDWKETHALKSKLLIVEPESKIHQDKPPEFELRTRIQANETTENTTENSEGKKESVASPNAFSAAETAFQIRVPVRCRLPHRENPTDQPKEIHGVRQQPVKAVSRRGTDARFRKTPGTVSYEIRGENINWALGVFLQEKGSRSLG